MSEKITKVVEKILSNPDWVGDVVPARSPDSELYFRVRGHAMSILRRQPSDDYGRYSLYVYPKWEGTSDELIYAYESSESIQLVAYHESQYEDLPLERLYNLVKSKMLDIDSVFDDILDGE